MRLLYALVLVLCVIPAFAGSVDSGIVPYERCALCHGLFGNTSRNKFPKLAGQNPMYLAQQIQHFLAGWRTNDNGQMATVVTEIDLSQIPEIVEWFASQAPPDPYDTYSTAGESLYNSAGCTDCHKELAGPDVIMPLLAAQHPVYLLKQMLELRDGERSSGDSDSVMHIQLQSLSDSDIESIANYLASLERR